MRSWSAVTCRPFSAVLGAKLGAKFERLTPDSDREESNPLAKFVLMRMYPPIPKNPVLSRFKLSALCVFLPPRLVSGFLGK